MSPRQTGDGGIVAAGARAAWRSRAVLVGGGFQVAFGALWIARGLAPFAPVTVAAGVGGVALIAGLTAAVLLRRRAPRPRGPAARTIERRLTGATILQLVASFALPIAISALAGPRLVLPSIVITIGILLVWVHREVDTPYQGTAGWLLIGLAVLSVPISGSTQTIVVGLSAATVLLGCAGAGLSWLRLGRGLA